MADSFPNHCVVCGTWISHPSFKQLYCSSRCNNVDKVSITPQFDLIPSSAGSPYLISNPSPSDVDPCSPSFLDELDSRLVIQSGQHRQQQHNHNKLLPRSYHNLASTEASSYLSLFRPTSIASHCTTTAGHLRGNPITGQPLPYPHYSSLAHSRNPSTVSLSPLRSSFEYSSASSPSISGPSTQSPPSPSIEEAKTGQATVAATVPSSPLYSPSIASGTEAGSFTTTVSSCVSSHSSIQNSSYASRPLPPRTNPLWSTSSAMTRSDLLVYPIPAPSPSPTAVGSTTSLNTLVGSVPTLSLSDARGIKRSDPKPTRSKRYTGGSQSTSCAYATAPPKVFGSFHTSSSVVPDALLDFPDDATLDPVAMSKFGDHIQHSKSTINTPLGSTPDGRLSVRSASTSSLVGFTYSRQPVPARGGTLTSTTTIGGLKQLLGSMSSQPLAN